MNLLGKGNDPKFWSETVRNDDLYKFYRDEQLKNWEEYCTEDGIPSLKYTEFRLYALNGSRTEFQKPYYRRRVQVETATILALIYPEEEKYLNYAMDMIFAICGEYSWCIPAHLPNIMTQVRKKHLDLFACETAYTLATIYTLLGDRLDPLIKERIKYEVKAKVVDSFIERTDWAWATTNTANWAAVCAGSVGCTFMLLFPELFDEVKSRIAFAMENYLRGFKDDGFCAEGTHYWHYGFGFFCSYAEMLRTFTNGEDDYFKREKVHAIATFIQKVYLSGIKSISFSDGGETCHYQIGLLHFLKKEYPDVVVYSPKYSYINDGCGRFCWLVTAATWLDRDIYNNPAPDNAVAEYYGSDTEWLIKRTEAYGFAAKAGNNNEPHNHNDVGAFIIAKCGHQIITDPGPGVYSQQYFAAATRYGMIECSSLGHSVPYFGDTVQKFGSDFGSSDVKFEDGVFSFDMASSYGCDDVKSVKRSFSFTDTVITLCDSFDYSGNAPITERFVTRFTPEVSEGAVTVAELTVKFDPTVCTVSIREALTMRNTPLYFIDFELNEGVRDFTVSFE
ncbi:MAG: heparinase II/III family protein [Clostridia bacterium]|nr:heparinase II/III family protein [Clostridia bacterium]